MLIWPRIVCGSTECRLAHLVVRIFPSHLGAAIWWQHENLPGFSIQREGGNVTRRLAGTKDGTGVAAGTGAEGNPCRAVRKVCYLLMASLNSFPAPKAHLHRLSTANLFS
jgi:hypothetical protein